MTDLFADEPEIRVAHPQKMREIRVSGADLSATPEDIARAVAAQGGCPLTEVKVGDIKTTVRGTKTAWVRCPLEAATKIDKVGRLQIKWFNFKVELLDARPLQCHRCLEKGHVQAKCPAGNTDRSKCCYRCGTEGHEAGTCTAPAHCAIVYAVQPVARPPTDWEARRARPQRTGEKRLREGLPQHPPPQLGKKATAAAILPNREGPCPPLDMECEPSPSVTIDDTMEVGLQE
ncbi:uncharacterized protein [Linepithema humile]|uniref:uncharacterized protein n=1 Tax=Linepithema humile TaxID=83485 RepID=UPI00351DF886